MSRSLATRWSAAAFLAESCVAAASLRRSRNDSGRRCRSQDASARTSLRRTVSVLPWRSTPSTPRAAHATRVARRTPLCSAAISMATLGSELNSLIPRSLAFQDCHGARARPHGRASRSGHPRGVSASASASTGRSRPALARRAFRRGTDLQADPAGRRPSVGSRSSRFSRDLYLVGLHGQSCGNPPHRSRRLVTGDLHS